MWEEPEGPTETPGEDEEDRQTRAGGQPQPERDGETDTNRETETFG